MAYRQIYETVACPLRLDDDEYIYQIYATWSQRVPDSIAPSGVAVCLKVEVRSSTDVNYFKFPVFRFDANTGEFIDRATVSSSLGTSIATYESPDGLSTNLQNRSIYELPGTVNDDPLVIGGRLIVSEDLSVYLYTPDLYGQYSNTLWPWSGYWGGTDGTENTFIYDPTVDTFTQNSNSIKQAQLATYRASTGADLGVRIEIAGGSPEYLVGMNPTQGLAFSNNSVVTMFNYVTGQLMAVSQLPTWDTSTGETATRRKYGYDRYNSRILMVDLPTQTGGQESTVFVKGYNPIPVAHKIMPPVTVREPRVGRTSRVFTRVIGKNSEGVGNAAVTFSEVGTGDVKPVIVISDQYGYATAQLEGVSAGTSTVTATTEVIPDIFPSSAGQGSGAAPSLWVPDPHIDFNGQIADADVSGLDTTQVDWDKGTGGSPDFYGVMASTASHRYLRTSSAQLRIENGTVGSPTSAGNGTFGGKIGPFNTSDRRRVQEGNELWIGAWVRFPSGFNFSTDTDGLLAFAVRWSNARGAVDTSPMVEIRLKHGAGTTHTGYAIRWPNATNLDARHNFTAYSTGLIQPNTWHFLQYYVKVEEDTGVLKYSEQRLWLDETMVWELTNLNNEAVVPTSDPKAKYLVSTGGGALVEFTALEAISTNASTIYGLNFLSELQVFYDWEGGSPATQSMYIGNVVWSQDAGDSLPNDANGNKYIAPSYAEAL